jgi:hypothetical protein
MLEDPIVAEIHQIRDEYARRFNYDLDAMFRDIQEKQSRSGSTNHHFGRGRRGRTLTANYSMDVG